MMRPDSVLVVQDLQTHFYMGAGIVKSVNGVSFDLKRGETLAMVGESGSGKSVTSLSIMRLIAAPGKIAGGTIQFTIREGSKRDLVKAPEREMRRIRGNEISMIFQEPMSSLNPAYTVGDQIAEAVVLHQGKRRKAALKLAVEMLDLVGIPEATRRVRDYPHQMSGGMRQRVMIAIALSCRPTLLIADEPTTALDVTVQAQILDLMRRLQQDLGMSILFITHNLGVVAEIADRAIVLYGGRVVEQGAIADIFDRPKHPYTRGLLNSLPRLAAREGTKRERLEAIPGAPPDPLRLPRGCPFEPRCGFSIEDCSREVPALSLAGSDHLSRCIRHPEL